MDSLGESSTTDTMHDSQVAKMQEDIDFVPVLSENPENISWTYDLEQNELQDAQEEVS